MPRPLLRAGSRHACNGHAKEVEDDAQHLQHGLHLAPHVGGDHLAVLGTGGHHAQAGHGKLAGQNDAQHHRAAYAVPHHVNEGHSGEQFVGQRVGKLAEVRYHVPLAGQMAVQKISKAGGSKDDACDQIIRRLEGAICDASQAGEGHKDHEHRHQQDAGQSEFIGQIHTDSSNLLFCNSTIQIVKVAVVHQNIVELAGVQRLLAGNAHIAVHLRSIAGSAAQVQTALLVDAVAKHMHQFYLTMY